jgi:hypothetical protein
MWIKNEKSKRKKILEKMQIKTRKLVLKKTIYKISQEGGERW